MSDYIYIYFSLNPFSLFAFRFKMFASGIFPIGIRKTWSKSENLGLPEIDEKVNELIQFEKKLLNSTKKLKMLSKKKRRKHLENTSKLPSSKSISNSLAHRRRLRAFTPEEKKVINKWQEEDIIREKSQEKDHKSSSPFILTENVPAKVKKSLVIYAENDILSINDSIRSPILRSTSTAIKSYDTAISEQKNREHAALKHLAKQSNLVLNPLAVRGKKIKSQLLQTQSAPVTPISAQKKRVKIMLALNSSQDTSEYIRQLRSSPNVPYDADKKPSKGLLKANLMPSPINPYYKKKIGLNF